MNNPNLMMPTFFWLCKKMIWGSNFNIFAIWIKLLAHFSCICIASMTGGPAIWFIIMGKFQRYFIILCKTPHILYVYLVHKFIHCSLIKISFFVREYCFTLRPLHYPHTNLSYKMIPHRIYEFISTSISLTFYFGVYNIN